MPLYIASTVLLYRGAVEATKEAHHLILTLIKDPECDINDHIPRCKQALASHRSYDIPAASNHFTVHDSSRVSSSNASTLSSSNTSYPTAVVTSSRDVSRSEKKSRSHGVAVSCSHLPGNARWASPTYQTSGISDQPSSKRSSVSEVEPSNSSHVILSSRSSASRQLHFSNVSLPSAKVPTNRVMASNYQNTTTTTTTQVKTTKSSISSGKLIVSSKSNVTTCSGTVLTLSSRVTPSTTVGVTSSTTRVTTSSEYRSSKQLSYSNVAGGVVPTVCEQSSGITSLNDGMNGTPLPPAITNILSQVCQTRSPIVWNESYYPKTNHDIEESTMNALGVNMDFTQPLSVATSGGIFKPLPHEISPPIPSSTSPSSSCSPVVNTPSPPASMTTTIEEKPIQPIGTERAHRRTNTSPSPTLTGVPPLISTG